ncbi:hypothetical protein LTR86_004100 [Recurvomyces mirabilis]|nr:hypothetical protein LTR86_004100 [Recurvomyces mirabilis]
MAAPSPALSGLPSPDLNGQEFQQGLRVIVDPGEATQVDVVAVHGLNPTNSASHALSTWTKDDKLWLRDMLPAEAQTARVMLFAYNANVTFDSSTAGILEQANNLLNRLRMKRRGEEAERRPLIFIAHSLGGLVVKHAIVTAANVDRYKPIHRATYGLVFFGTPHQGSANATSLGKLAANIMRAVYHEPKNSFMDSLEKDSSFSQSLSNEFRSFAENYRIISFYETRPVHGIGIVVDQTSASLSLGANREWPIALNRDHTSLCRFNGMDDHDDYEQVEGNVCEMIEEAIKHSGSLTGLGITSSPPPATAYSPPLAATAAYSPPLSGATAFTPPMPHTTAYTPLLPHPASSPDIKDANSYPGFTNQLPPPARNESYQGSIRSEPAIDSRSLVDSINQSTMSLALSDASSEQYPNGTNDGNKRNSTSTVTTEYSTLDKQRTNSGTTSSGRHQVQSPSLFSSISMNISDGEGTAFRLAAAEGDYARVKFMLEKGVAIDNSGVWDGYTALADAALHGQEEVIELLLEKGANPAFHCISSKKRYGSKENTPLSLAAAKNHIGSMKILLQHHVYAPSEIERARAAAKDRNRLDAQRLLNDPSSWHL